MDRSPDVTPIRSLSIAVVGANHPNKDGGNRRSEIAFCDPGEVLELRPEPNNPHDEHAIAVFSARRFQIGYVASQRAVYLRSLIRGGHSLHAIFQDVAPWGAIARVGINGTPSLPLHGEQAQDEACDADAEPAFYPDDIPPDD
ncbi:MAG: HIRAN domain-containing protein [Sphingomonas fennica]